MLQTLISIPHEIGGLPVFGFGWALILWGIASVIIVGVSWRRGGWSEETNEWARMLGVFGLAIAFVLPFLEANDPINEGKKLGLTIRSYGVMMLLGVLSGVGLAISRGRRMGFHPDLILSLCVWMFVCGIIGARLFYVIQYSEEFSGGNAPLDWLVKIVKITEGGLVVYGSVIGAVLALTAFVIRHKLNPLQIGDIVAPAMLLGLALGRLGCFFNGCCWGGVCDVPLPSVQFPVGSSPYMQQLDSLQLVGIELEKVKGEKDTFRVTKVAPDSPLSQRLKEGDVVSDIRTMQSDLLKLRHRAAQVSSKSPDEPEVEKSALVYPALSVTKGDDEVAVLLPQDLPARSRPVHPTQIYSSVNAFILFLFLYAYFPYRKRDGEIFALMMTFYPITRTLLEIIRNDEAGQFGTTLTVSQWVSVIALCAIVALWIYISRQPRRAIESPKFS